MLKGVKQLKENPAQSLSCLFLIHYLICVVGSYPLKYSDPDIFFKTRSPRPLGIRPYTGA
jgi:hypothetical protein